MTTPSTEPPAPARGFHDATIDRFTREGVDVRLDIEGVTVHGEPDIPEGAYERGHLQIHNVRQVKENDVAVAVPSFAFAYGRILDLETGQQEVRLLVMWQRFQPREEEFAEYLIACDSATWVPGGLMPDEHPASVKSTRVADYLGCSASTMLADEQFRSWPVVKSVEEDIDELCYCFEQHGLELRCKPGEIIASIFLHADDPSGLIEGLLELPFATTREQVRAHFGTPEKSGPGHRDKILGVYGPWDRFERPGHFIHVQFRADADSIQMITLMRADVAP